MGGYNSVSGVALCIQRSDRASRSWYINFFEFVSAVVDIVMGLHHSKVENNKYSQSPTILVPWDGV